MLHIRLSLALKREDLTARPSRLDNRLDCDATTHGVIQPVTATVSGIMAEGRDMGAAWANNMNPDKHVTRHSFTLTIT